MIQSSPIRKYCYVPGGKKIQSSLDTTVVSGTLRSPAISQLNRIASSPGVLIHEWLRFTRTKITLCRIALLNRQDHLHEPAEQLYKKRMKSGFCFLTTSAVLDETANALCDPAFKPSVITFFHNIKNSPGLRLSLSIPVCGRRDGHSANNGLIKPGALPVASLLKLSGSKKFMTH